MAQRVQEKYEKNLGQPPCSTSSIETMFEYLQGSLEHNNIGKLLRIQVLVINEIL